MKITVDDAISPYVELYIDNEKDKYCISVDTDTSTVTRYINNGKGGCEVDKTKNPPEYVLETVQCDFKLKPMNKAPEWVIEWFNINVPEAYKQP